MSPKGTTQQGGIRPRVAMVRLQEDWGGRQVAPPRAQDPLAPMPAWQGTRRPGLCIGWRHVYEQRHAAANFWSMLPAHALTLKLVALF